MEAMQNVKNDRHEWEDQLRIYEYQPHIWYIDFFFLVCVKTMNA